MLQQMEPVRGVYFPAVLALMLLSVRCAPAASGQEIPMVRVVDKTRMISTSGQAELHVVPNQFSIVFSVKTFDKVLPTAYSFNDKSVAAIVALAAKYKIPAQKVQVSDISVDPSYDREYSSYTPTGKAIGYYVQKSIGFEFSDAKSIAPLIKDALAAGANSISSVNYGTSELRKHRDQARTMALKAAREKAILLAEEVGSTLGDAIQISEESAPSFYRQTAQNVMSNVGFEAPSTPSSEDGGLALGQIKVTSSVRATFELKSK